MKKINAIISLILLSALNLHAQEQSSVGQIMIANQDLAGTSIQKGERVLVVKKRCGYTQTHPRKMQNLLNDYIPCRVGLSKVDANNNVDSILETYTTYMLNGEITFLTNDPEVTVFENRQLKANLVVRALSDLYFYPESFTYSEYFKWTGPNSSVLLVNLLKQLKEVPQGSIAKVLFVMHDTDHYGVKRTTYKIEILESSDKSLVGSRLWVNTAGNNSSFFILASENN